MSEVMKDHARRPVPALRRLRQWLSEPDPIPTITQGAPDQPVGDRPDILSPFERHQQDQIFYTKHAQAKRFMRSANISIKTQRVKP